MKDFKRLKEQKNGPFLQPHSWPIALSALAIIGFPAFVILLNLFLQSVVPVNWTRFQAAPALSDDARQCGRMLLNAARHNLAWAVETADYIEKNGGRISGREAHDIIRPACGGAYALAVVLKTGLYDQQDAGVSRPEAVKRAARLIRAASEAHKGRAWLYPWQSSFWAANLAHAAWLLWDELDGQTRHAVKAMVLNEADRKIGYPVPYWNGMGGDTKAEENAWDSSILLVAVAMMPRHPGAHEWKRAATELMVSAYAYETDMRNTAAVDGKAAKDWLRGFNVRSDGAVINHDIIHPDYMACFHFTLRGLMTQSLARQTVSEAAGFNASRIYHTLAMTPWPSPPYQEPGGPIYKPNMAEVYYPMNTDWTPLRYDLYYLVDVYAHLLGWDAGLPHSAASWMRIRASKILEMQSRFPDGRMFGDGEYEAFPGREQDAAWLLADAFLLFWLRDRDALSPRGDWLQSAWSFSRPPKARRGLR